MNAPDKPRPAWLSRTLGTARRYWREGALGFLLLALLVAVLTCGAITQDLAYHDFADRRRLLGVPNLLNVASNLPFLIVGVLGVALCAGQRRPPQARSWTTLFIGCGLTSFGSAAYHWAPSNASLVWDRLPMALSFVSLFVALLAEHIDKRLDRVLLATALAMGVFSVLWWRWTGDLRFYVWVQFAPLLSIPVQMVLYAGRFTHRRYVAYGLGLYGLAKLAELWDHEIFRLTDQTLSGHSLKHLLAAGALLVLIAMLWRRRPLAVASPGNST